MELASILKKYGIPFTLIDSKEYFHHRVGGLRGCLDESKSLRLLAIGQFFAILDFSDYLPKTMINFKKSFGDSFECGNVTNIDLDSRTVRLDNGKTIRYTDLVIAVGSNGPFPTVAENPNVTESAEEFKQLGKEIEKATNIIIVGGGTSNMTIL